MLLTGIKLDKVKNYNKLPRTIRNKKEMINNGLHRIMSEDVEEIYQGIRCREEFDDI